jgi:hypothetical protein
MVETAGMETAGSVDSVGARMSDGGADDADGGGVDGDGVCPPTVAGSNRSGESGSDGGVGMAWIGDSTVLPTAAVEYGKADLGVVRMCSLAWSRAGLPMAA